MTDTKEPTTTKPEAWILLKMIWKYRNTAAKLAAMPLFFLVAEFSQVLAAVAMLSLLLPMPAGVLNTSAGAFGGWSLFRYAAREIPQHLRGKGRRPTSTANQLIGNAAQETFGRSRPATRRQQPTPEQAAMLAQLVAGMRKAAPDDKPGDGDGNIGQYL